MKKKIHQLHCRKVRGRWSHCHFGIQDRWKKQICFFVHVSQQEAKTKCSALGSGLPGILSELIQFACGAGGGQGCTVWSLSWERIWALQLHSCIIIPNQDNLLGDERPCRLEMGTTTVNSINSTDQEVPG